MHQRWTRIIRAATGQSSIVCRWPASAPIQRMLYLMSSCAIISLMIHIAPLSKGHGPITDHVNPVFSMCTFTCIPSFEGRECNIHNLPGRDTIIRIWRIVSIDHKDAGGGTNSRRFRIRTPDPSSGRRISQWPLSAPRNSFLYNEEPEELLISMD